MGSLKALEYANGRFRQRSAAQAQDDPDRAEGRLFAASVLYPIDFWKGLSEGAGYELKHSKKSTFVCHFIPGVVFGGALEFLDAPLSDAAIWTTVSAIVPSSLGIAMDGCEDRVVYSSAVAGSGLATGLALGYGLTKSVRNLFF